MGLREPAFGFTQKVKHRDGSFAIMDLRYRERAPAAKAHGGKGSGMQNVELLMASLEYIENHLGDEIRTEDVAAACFCSKSTLEKMFRCVNHISIHDYVTRRRMTLAARRLSAEPELSILDVALEYGYGTHESFARAFLQVWNCKPSEFRKAKYTELFPRFLAPPEEGDDFIMHRRHVDISELYDLFRERKDCFFVCCDIKNMTAVNEISHKAGDLAILEEMRRLNYAAGENDMVFRIGGDEFCVLTDSSRKEYAERIAEDVRKRNGETFAYDDRKIPLSLYVTVVSLEECNRYEEVFNKLHVAIKDCKPYQE